MRTVFDIADARYVEWVYFAIPLILFAVAAYGRFVSQKKKWSKVVLGFGLVTLALMFVPLWDFTNLRAAVRDGKVKVVEGVVSGAWTTEEREARRTGDIGYRYRTWEGFDVGGVTFGYWRGFASSSASFTNRGKPVVAIADGMPARVTYFVQGDERRILKLELGDAPGAATTAPRGDVGDFAAIWTRFATAAAAGHSATVKSLTKFPFLFESRELEAANFDSIWMGLFTPPVRECIGRAQPQAEDDRFGVFCAPYAFYFDKTADGWRFTEFAADPES